MIRTKRFLSFLLAAMMLLAVSSAPAESSLAGTTYVLNTYQTADGNAVCTVLTQQAALDWIVVPSLLRMMHGGRSYSSSLTTRAPSLSSSSPFSLSISTTAGILSL